MDKKPELEKPFEVCPECGGPMVWDDPNRSMPVLVCPRCMYMALQDCRRELEALRYREELFWERIERGAIYFTDEEITTLWSVLGWAEYRGVESEKEGIEDIFHEIYMKVVNRVIEIRKQEKEK